MAPLETKLIFQGPIFHFHDYGRKSHMSSKFLEELEQRFSPISRDQW